MLGLVSQPANSEMAISEMFTGTNSNNDGNEIGNIADGSHSEESLLLRSEFLLN
jgi:hypothetical protein